MRSRYYYSPVFRAEIILLVHERYFLGGIPMEIHNGSVFELSYDTW